MMPKSISANAAQRCAASPSIVGLWLALAFSLAATAHLPAAVRTWTGGSASSGNWSAAPNWSSGAPVAGDILNFVDTAARKTSNTNNFPPGTTFSVINCFGTGYRLRGNRVTITNSVKVGNPAGNHILDLDLTFGGADASISLGSFAAAARLTLNGDINLGAHILETEGPGDYIITGVISGTGGIFKISTGDLSLSGLGANTFTGATIVGAGVLRLNRYILSGLNQVGTVAIPGDLSIGGFSSTLTADLVVFENNNQIANTSTVSVLPTGALVLGGENDTLGELRLSGGTVSTTTGSLGVEGGIYATMPILVSKDSLIAGKLTLGARGDGPQIIDVAAGVKLNITAQISGVSTADLIKTNRGELMLTSSNLFSGDVEMKGGLLTMTDGNALGSTNGVTKLISGTLAINPIIPFGIREHLEVSGPFGTLSLVDSSASWLGNVTLDDDLSIITGANSSLTILGLISGPAGWTKTGDGTLQFKTAYTNDYAGTSWVREGNFIMDGVMNQPVIPGPFIIGNATDPTHTTRAWPIKQNQIGNNSPVTLNHSGVLQLGDLNDTVGALTFNGGAVETGPGTLRLNGDILALATSQTARISGNLSLGGVTRTIHTLGASNATNLEISAVISDGGAAAGFNKIGEGSLRVSGANAFSGPVSVTDGTLRIANPDALGSTAAGTTVSGIDGARIVLEGGVGMTIDAEPLTLNSTGPGSPIVLENFTGNNHWNGPITLLAPESVIHVPSIPRPLSLGGVISGPGGLKKTGAGSLTLGGTTTNTFNGLTFVEVGDLILDKPGDNEALNGDVTIGDGLGSANSARVRIRGGGSEINNDSRILLNNSGQLLLEGVLDLVGSIEGSGNISLINGPGTAGLIVGRNDLSTTYSGVLSGDGNFQKVGAGTLTLTGTSSYTGETGLSEGTLIVNGSIAASSLLYLNLPLFPNNWPAILGGHGTVPKIYPYPDGILAPGASAGRLTVQGELALTNDIVRFELNGTTPGVSYDQLRVNGLVKLGNSRLELTFGFTPVIDESFMLIQNDGNDPVQGTFAGIPQASYFSAGGMTFYLEYNGGDDDNDVVITRVSTAALIINSISAKAEKMVIEGQGVSGLSYVLEASPHLNAPIPWTPIATNTANALGIYEFIDAYVDHGMNLHPARFYRVRSP